jgi:galactarate dehydratase
VEEGAPIRRYGQVIGTASRAIPRGSWVEESLVRLPAAPSLADLKLATATPSAPPPLRGYTFEGYRNPDGSVGTRNLLGISTSVQCVAGVVEHAAKLIRERLLPRYPNVDGVVALTHGYGCGVAINAPGAAVPVRTLRNIARNPNFGGAPMVVGLGCEKMFPEWILEDGRPAPAPATPTASSACRTRDMRASATCSPPSWRWRRRGSRC